MSTGAPVSSVDTISPALSTHGHYQPASPRGHSRSKRWSQGPISYSASDAASIQPQLSQSLIEPRYSNGNTSRALHGHQHSHSHSSHGEPWAKSDLANGLHSHTPKHSHSGSVTGLVPSTPILSPNPESSRIHERLAGVLIALPWIAISWYYGHHATWAPAQPATDGENIASSGTGNLDRIALRTCTLTAVTMIILGGGQLLRVQRDRRDSLVALPKIYLKPMINSAAQMISIALPIYAALKVGGFLVAFALALAIASGVPAIVHDCDSKDSKGRLSQKKLIVSVIVAVVVLSFLGMNSLWDAEPFLGYVSLLVSTFAIRPPFARLTTDSTYDSISGEKLSRTESSGIPSSNPTLTALLGLLLAAGTAVVGGLSFHASDMMYVVAAAGGFATCLMYVVPANLRSPHKIGLAIATGGAALLCAPPPRDNVYVVYVFRGILAGIAVLASRYGDRHLRLAAQAHNHHHHHTHTDDASRITKLILRYSEPYPLLYSILKESDSRRIFYFMGLNFAFMLVQLSYGFLTGSLGLLSDSIHMFFDCLALVVGLCAAVMSKWPPSARFPYGYGKVDTLSGFANGIFLMIISIEIIYEAAERLSTGSQMHRIGELLVVSIAGLLVNLVGIMAFDHAHHGHDHGHGHSHDNENMHGIFLHILADTLGSVAVVISTILVHYSGWPGYDPIASCMIAILIFASAVPLVSGTAKKLLLTLPADVEYNVRETLAGVSTLRGVVGYTVPKFWLDDTAKSDHDHSCSHGHSHSHSHSHDHAHNHDHAHSHSHSHDHVHTHDHAHSHKPNPNVLGVIHIIASRTAEPEDVRQRAVDFLREKNMNVLVQVEREGDGRCWCGGNKT
ncbi:cation efflux family-domain-containing protein [Aspergillus coremiiformis]|uniref:Zinc transporter n=1 Tax=Aspergillus coremiiformis TaxID=138285 RepID=A0A5N6Z9E3_9EURO|nr:cation efflux family-domain-containing protein [Aspergillus coremiiformis]